MPNSYYNSTDRPTTGSAGSSEEIRNQFEAIEEGFDKLPELGVLNAGKAVYVNEAGTALVSQDLAVARQVPDTTGHANEVLRALSGGGYDWTPETMPEAELPDTDGQNGRFLQVDDAGTVVWEPSPTIPSLIDELPDLEGNEGSYLRVNESATEIEWGDFTIPDPTGHDGEFLRVNGSVYEYAPLPLSLNTESQVIATGTTVTINSANVQVILNDSTGVNVVIPTPAVAGAGAYIIFIVRVTPASLLNSYLIRTSLTENVFRSTAVDTSSSGTRITLTNEFSRGKVVELISDGAVWIVRANLGNLTSLPDGMTIP